MYRLPDHPVDVCKSNDVVGVSRRGGVAVHCEFCIGCDGPPERHEVSKRRLEDIEGGKRREEW